MAALTHLGRHYTNTHNFLANVELFAVRYQLVAYCAIFVAVLNTTITTESEGDRGDGFDTREKNVFPLKIKVFLMECSEVITSIWLLDQTVVAA